ncbi:hypothetical protein [Absidia glauca]|uniref:BZIP domain-containing protein n=1 Tax=Absidia glauca TaxID=4829 RepID=A0A168KUX7_ABSGL|nr:hypothetical protein [Absidia glauca]
MVNDQVSHAHIANTTMDPKSVLVENSASSMNGPIQHPTESHIYAQVSNSPPMAVLPLNPSAKLDQEPNPFEQSFSSASKTSPKFDKTKLPGTASSSSASTSSSSSIVTPATISSSSSSSTNSTNSLITSEPLKLPPVAAMTSPAATSVMSSVPKDIASQYAWDSLRAGPLSPSMLQRPTNPDDFTYATVNPSSSLLNYTEYTPSTTQGKIIHSLTHSLTRNSSLFIPSVKSEHYHPEGHRQPSPIKYQDKQDQPRKSNRRTLSNSKDTPTIPHAASPQSPTTTGQRRKTSLQDDNSMGGNDKDNDEDSSDGHMTKKPRPDDEDEKRKNFLERNRLAALKCRQRKKQWLNNLQAKVEFLTNDNEQLQIQTNTMREEIMNLKTLLLAHKDCSVSQANAAQQQAVLQAAAPSTVPTSSSVLMAPMYTPQPFPPHPQQQHRLSTSSTSSGGLNMVMVSQHQAPSAVSSSSGVMQF